MRVSVGVGCYAKKPYRIPGLEIDVYSMEELCYCIRENAFLLDASFLSGALLDRGGVRTPGAGKKPASSGTQERDAQRVCGSDFELCGLL